MCFERSCNRERLDGCLSNINTNVFCGNRFVGTVENGRCSCCRRNKCGCGCGIS